MEADGIFSGGGIKGLAFVGALKAAQEAGYDKWVQVGGTSAGAITAACLAAGYSADSLHSTLQGYDYSKIEDDKPWLVGQGYDLLFRKGLTRGEVLQHWIQDLLAQSPVKPKVFGDVPQLKVVGSDLAHNRMVVFPNDVGNYLDDKGNPFVPANFPVDVAVRISAGFPFFFPPLYLKHAVTGKMGCFVDGGVCSQFPLFLFDNTARPTWGFRLYDGDSAAYPNYDAIDGLDWPKDMLLGVVDTAINSLDNFEALHFPNEVVNIPTGAVDTLNFSLTQSDKDFLYNSGYQATKDFFGR